MKTKMVLNEAVQVGPWRVARKHLLFVIIFGLVIIAFGFIILQTHVFDNEEEGEDDDEGDEEGDEDWAEFGESFSGGDWVMVAIMVAAGLLSLIAVFVCVLVKKNSPRRLSTSQRNASIYSVQFNSSETKNPAPVQSSFGAPQQLPVWSGQLVQQRQQQQQQEQQKRQQPILTLPQVLTAPQIHRAARTNAAIQQNSVEEKQSHVRAKQVEGASAPEASAPQYEGERPPPYSP